MTSATSRLMAISPRHGSAMTNGRKPTSASERREHARGQRGNGASLLYCDGVPINTEPVELTYDELMGFDDGGEPLGDFKLKRDVKITMEDVYMNPEHPITQHLIAIRRWHAWQRLFRWGGRTPTCYPRRVFVQGR